MGSLASMMPDDAISCLRGTLCIAQEGNQIDCFQEVAQNFWVTRHGTVIVQALHNAWFTCNLNEFAWLIENNTLPVPQSFHDYRKYP